MRSIMINLVLMWYYFGFLRNGNPSDNHINMGQWNFTCPECGDSHCCENCQRVIDSAPAVFMFANIAYYTLEGKESMYIVNDSERVKMIEPVHCELSKTRQRGFVIWQNNDTAIIDSIKIKRIRQTSKKTGKRYIAQYSVTLNGNFVLKFARLYSLLDFLESSYTYERGQWVSGRITIC